jgi:SAM-dependent methyltransferase
MDARPESADLIGPAKQHLFASQVDPRCFDLIPHATLWHATHGTLEVDRQEGFPEHHQDYCLIGGAVSVGNTTLALLNVLGYRTIHVFGMDCSHRDGKSHAYAQPLNDGDPVTLVEFNSQLYTCSVSMSLQCKHFLERARALETQGCAIHVHGYGLLPDVWNAPVGLLSEREKYEHMWTFPRYRESSPGEALVSDFVAEMQPISDASIIDFGCGPGRATQKLHDMGYDAIGVDIAANCLDADVTIPLVVSPFWELPPALHADYGFCCDVMEHIEPHRVDDVLAAISQCVHRGCYLQIAFTPDNFGPALIGEPLHLTVESADWWASKLREYFVYVNVKPSGDGWRGIFICKEPIRRSH